jgi:hypothetical protein
MTLVELFKDSSVIKKIVNDARDEGEMKGVRSVLLRQGRQRFGEPDEDTLKAVNAITDLSRLERMAEVIFDVPGWNELLATR